MPRSQTNFSLSVDDPPPWHIFRTRLHGVAYPSSTNSPTLVEHLQYLDALLVLREDGVYRVDPKQLRANAIETPLDPFTPVHEVETLPQGDAIADAAAVAG